MNQEMLTNVLSLRRSELFNSLLNVGKDINASCGYPTYITISDYKTMFDREGLGKRVVNILPEGCWSSDPEVIENEKDETEFEKNWKALEKKFKIYHYLHRADVLSGIGRFGVLLIGVSDGEDLSKPIKSINEKTGEKQGNTNYNLLYLRPFDESSVMVSKKETDTTSPRFGFPTEYSVQFEDSSQLNTGTSVTKTVHWTRIIHLADNLESSEVYGTPRMKPVYNRLLDVRKVLSGSGEMFWKGAFPGYAFEINPEIKNPTLDTESIREEFQNYANGLQRYLAIEGVTAKSLEPQVSSPGDHLKSQLEYIGLTLGIPLRILLGSEQAKLASTQDKETWNERLATRQNKYVSPMVLRPFIDRMITVGVLEEPKESYTILWQDLNTSTDKDKAEVGRIRTESIARYVIAGADILVPPKEFMSILLDMSEEEINAIELAAKSHLAEEPEEVEDE